MEAERVPGPTERPREPYWRVMGNLGVVALGLVAVGWSLSRGPKPGPVPVELSPAPKLAPPMVVAPPPVEAPAPVVVPEPIPLDQEAVAAAEEALDAASRDRARADARAAAAAKGLAEAAARAASEAKAAKALASRVRDPSARISSASARGNFLKAERERLKDEVGRLATVPRPRAKVLSNKNPVARPAEGDEYHFEVRNDRVSTIDLERLLELVKKDAQLRIRLGDGVRVVTSRVGPVGAFSLDYVLSKSLPLGLDGLMSGQASLAYNLRGWEVVPQFEGRGETYEATRAPISDFARTISRLNPARDTVTIWVYPSGFGLFRKLRDDLRDRGFLVAARPLPDGMAIRGSPGGSLSAGQ